MKCSIVAPPPLKRSAKPKSDMEADSRYYSGKLLLAMPGIGDPRFERSVIAMCSHDDGGALGIGIGHIMPRVGLHEVLKQLDIDPGKAPDVPVHHGGPVEPARGFVLHSRDWSGQGTVDVAGLWALTGTLDVLNAIASGKGPSAWLVAMGYAGWSSGQLEGEMARHGWHLVDGSAEILFETPSDTRWQASFLKSGIDPALLTSVSGSA